MYNASLSALACLISFRTYGTRLHGDERGSIDHTRNRYGDPLLERNPRREGYERGLLRHAPTRLDAKAQRIVRETLQEVCRFRNWPLHAIAVEAEHAHTLLSSQAAPDQVLGELESWSTRRLREAGIFGPDTKVWGRHGSKRWIFDQDAVHRALAYVARHPHGSGWLEDEAFRGEGESVILRGWELERGGPRLTQGAPDAGAP